jgi:hypothetical protein
MVIPVHSIPAPMRFGDRADRRFGPCRQFAATKKPPILGGQSNSTFTID